MARLIAMIEGNRGQASRLGSADSGIRAQAQGWRVGVTVYGKALDDGTDEFHVYATSGSGGGHPSRLVGVVTLDESGRPTFTAEEANS